jgi:quercetin dioxygenase-like cupin family protein
MNDFMFDTSAGDWQSHPRFAGAALRPLITTAQNQGMTVSLVRLMPGCELPLHSHPNSTETFYILSGVAFCRVADQAREMRSGDMGYAPPGVAHQVHNLGSEPVEALSIFNPPLEPQ